MKQNEQSPRHHEFLRWYLSLPNQILALQTRDNVTEFVLHALCNKKCFNLEKAAYFVDNPAFDCFKGVAGYHRQEEYTDPSAMWQSPDQFTEHMRTCVFNQKVRAIEQQSVKKIDKAEPSLVAQLSDQLSFEEPLFFRWNIKHDNEGLLLFEVNDEAPHDELLNGLCLLGFCPIF